ncbi:hypothetical protein AcV5_002369 [Taiwanofungus camphoratus]|nr:hypothetical protein AcV5_002369 [Antrodia cinnamomea]
MSYHDMRNVNCNSHTVTPLEYPIAVFTPGVGRDLPPGSPRRICKVTYTPIPRPQSGQLPSLNTAKVGARDMNQSLPLTAAEPRCHLMNYPTSRANTANFFAVEWTSLSQAICLRVLTPIYRHGYQRPTEPSLPHDQTLHSLVPSCFSCYS